ncbi:hypothetical protein E1B28_000034 [Marasmius oreades]|uniref:Uncharacterized protein n=1 Tax=Marasmius oreades TaxID=181124 RepID=A0A9P7V0P3_9AGAR|nr:uncharacterized protein E1B28_000034 [Marasmius oreades]KAG7098060.1 hypothetical protein E1B28_000034 [Marasmius oreades]
MAGDSAGHIANATNDDIFTVMVSLNPNWEIADFTTNVNLLFAAIKEIKQVANDEDLPNTFVTIRDLYEFTKISAKLLSIYPEPALAVINAFKKNSIRISSGQYKQVKTRDALGSYLNKSGTEYLLKANTVSLMVVSGDGQRVAMYNTNSEYSWIAADNGEIVRAKDGSIGQQGPQAGVVDWSTMGGN